MPDLWQTHPMNDVTLTRGSGCRVWNDRGRPYLDMLAGCWCAVLGHGHPRLTAAVTEQMTALTHTGPPFASDALHAGLAKLAEVLPAGLSRVVLVNTGSEAVELALKMARAAREADTVVVIERSYYGATTYALALSEAGRGLGWLPAVGAVQRLPAPDCRNCPAGVKWPCDGFPCLDGFSRYCDLPIAAVLFEPILANAGVVTPPVGYGRRLYELARECGALFIAEEVTTGLGRTGRWFGTDHDEITPDILVLGKALGGGLPVAAVATTAEVEERCAGRLTHVQSHQNDPLSGRIVETVVSVIREDGLVARVARMGDYLADGLRSLQSKHSLIREVRGRGLLLGVALLREHAEAGQRIARSLLEAGIIVNYQPHNAAFRLFPPYVITTAEVDEFLSAFDAALGRATD